MMWSQCTCDMKMLTVAGRRACLASTCTPKGRAPLPMSQTKYSLAAAVSSSTHGVWPPKVWVSEKSSSEVAKACASS